MSGEMQCVSPRREIPGDRDSEGWSCQHLAEFGVDGILVSKVVVECVEDRGGLLAGRAVLVDVPSPVSIPELGCVLGQRFLLLRAFECGDVGNVPSIRERSRSGRAIIVHRPGLAIAVSSKGFLRQFGIGARDQSWGMS